MGYSVTHISEGPHLSRRPIVIAGHSHVTALIGGKEWVGVMQPQSIASGLDDSLLSPVRDHEGVFGLRGDWPRTKDYWSTLARLASDYSIALLWEGNQHNSLFLVEQPIPFDFVPRGLEFLPVADDAIIVPEAVVRAKFQSLNGNLEETLADIKTCPDCKVALVGTPPPPVLPAKYGDVRITPSIVRLKLWHVMTEIMREEAEANGVGFIAVPDVVKDKDGFLKPDFWTNDSTHANPAYGEIMLSHIAQTL
jgi:hypothetical protein